MNLTSDAKVCGKPVEENGVIYGIECRGQIDCEQNTRLRVISRNEEIINDFNNGCFSGVARPTYMLIEWCRNLEKK